MYVGSVEFRNKLRVGNYIGEQKIKMQIKDKVRDRLREGVLKVMLGL